MTKLYTVKLNVDGTNTFDLSLEELRELLQSRGQSSVGKVSENESIEIARLDAEIKLYQKLCEDYGKDVERLTADKATKDAVIAAHAEAITALDSQLQAARYAVKSTEVSDALTTLAEVRDALLPRVPIDFEPIDSTRRLVPCRHDNPMGLWSVIDTQLTRYELMFRNIRSAVDGWSPVSDTDRLQAVRTTVASLSKSQNEYHNSSDAAFVERDQALAENTQLCDIMQKIEDAVYNQSLDMTETVYEIRRLLCLKS